jgi:hypothetical protein
MTFLENGLPPKQGRDLFSTTEKKDGYRLMVHKETIGTKNSRIVDNPEGVTYL